MVEESLKWSNEAYKLAIGDATRLQWSVSNILNYISLAPEKSEKIFSLTDDLFKHAFSLEDSFSGRNLRYLNSLKKRVLEDNKVNGLRAHFMSKEDGCDKLLQKDICKDFFSSI